MLETTGYAVFNFLEDLCVYRRNLLVEQQQQTFLTMKHSDVVIRMTATISTVMTSRSKYWYEMSSKAAVRKCGAPRYLITKSVQKIAVSNGD